jgi:hypothetical protein
MFLVRPDGTEELLWNSQGPFSGKFIGGRITSSNFEPLLVIVSISDSILAITRNESSLISVTRLQPSEVLTTFSSLYSSDLISWGSYSYLTWLHSRMDG